MKGMFQSNCRGVRERAGRFLAGFLTGLCIVTGLPATTSDAGRLDGRLKQGVFLLAVPELRDPNFLHTVVLLVTYGQGGAMGLIINRSSDIPLDKALPDVEGIEGLSQPLFLGGPVSRNLLVALLRSNKPPEGAQKVFDSVYFAGDEGALVNALQERSPDKKVRVYAGYAGWGAGQLDREVGRGDWIIMDANPERVFTEDPSMVWSELIKIREQIEVHRQQPLAIS